MNNREFWFDAFDLFLYSPYKLAAPRNTDMQDLHSFQPIVPVQVFYLWVLAELCNGLSYLTISQYSNV